ncbi:hypothetical protein FHL15_008084 [Xylaria flabelliformis]|uniref:Uncharacterized protein n=1 Tax=Xylaria flabelliformis TaxID=2512241 RepID=A0A553HT18_9PEZI|nr:hypothetical protein FHL15_008084 [Xylaria flabelliformis]
MSGLQWSRDASLMARLAENSGTYEESTGISNTGAPAPPLPLPLILNAHTSWGIEGMSTFYYCGQSTEDRLYAVKVQHVKSGGKPPLSKRRGLLLHSGPSTSSPVIAAAADEKKASSRQTNPDSDIILVNTQYCNNDNDDVATDIMRSRITDGNKVAFTFQVEVGVGFERRKDVFSWIRVAKKEAGLVHGGYKLVRHPPKPEGSRHWSTHDMSNEDDLLAILSNGKGLQVTLSPYLFTIQFVDEYVLGEIGYNLARTILVTAARLYHLKASHRMSS